MALDLSALEEKPTAPAVAGAAQPTGKPLDIPLADIEEDPDQPRKEFTPEADAPEPMAVAEAALTAAPAPRAVPFTPSWVMLALLPNARPLLASNATLASLPMATALPARANA